MDIVDTYVCEGAATAPETVEHIGTESASAATQGILAVSILYYKHLCVTVLYWCLAISVVIA